MGRKKQIKITEVKHWNQEKIAAEILRLYSMDYDLSYQNMRENRGDLLSAGIRYFGSWQEAIEWSGLDYSQIRKDRPWNKKKIIRLIQELYQKGEDLSWRYISQESSYTALAAAAVKKKYFGSWENAIKAAGLNYNEIRRYEKWTEKKIIAQIRRLHRQKEDLSSKYMQRTHSRLFYSALRRFGSWEQAIAQAGLNYARIRKRDRWDKDKILTMIVKLKKKKENLKNAIIRKKYSAFHAAACKKRYFGTWTRALEGAAKSGIVSGK